MPDVKDDNDNNDAPSSQHDSGWLEPDSCAEEDVPAVERKKSSRGSKRSKNPVDYESNSSVARPQGYFTPADPAVVAELYIRVQKENVLSLTCVADRKAKESQSTSSAASVADECSSDSNDEGGDAMPSRKRAKFGLGLRGKRHAKPLTSNSHSSADSYDFDDDATAAKKSAAGTRVQRAKKERKTKGDLGNVLSTMWRFGLLESFPESKESGANPDDMQSAVGGAPACEMPTVGVKRKRVLSYDSPGDILAAGDTAGAQMRTDSQSPLDDLAFDDNSPSKDRQLKMKLNRASRVAGKLGFY